MEKEHDYNFNPVFVICDEIILMKLVFPDKLYKETIAQKLSEILEIDYQELLEKINNNTKRFSVASNVEQNKVEQIKEWKNKLDFSTGIIFEETTSRTYP